MPSQARTYHLLVGALEDVAVELRVGAHLGAHYDADQLEPGCIHATVYQLHDAVAHDHLACEHVDSCRRARDAQRWGTGDRDHKTTLFSPHPYSKFQKIAFVAPPGTTAKTAIQEKNSQIQ
jgi:hypothetical protein